MYSLDINFLKDRTQRLSEAGLASAPRIRDDPRPLYIGTAIGIALPLFVLGFWFIAQNQTQTLEQRQAEVNGRLQSLQADLNRVKEINAQIDQIDTENKALATVFDRIKPWSAILQDVRDRVPNGVQVTTIEQFVPEATANKPAAAPSPSPSPSASPNASPGASPAAPAPAASAAPAPSVRVTGTARSFNDVNDFVLTLQRSPFLNGKDVKLVSSTLIDNPTQIEFADKERSNNLQVNLPQVVQYTIEGSLTNLTASDLLQDLERTLSVGLAARIQALRDRGVLKP